MRQDIPSQQSSLRASSPEEKPTHLSSSALSQPKREEKRESSIQQLLGFFQAADKKRPEAVLKLLTHVVRGEEAEAKAMIEEDSSLLRQRGQVVDYSGRTIEGTAFQLALGAEDVEMAEMIAPYLDNDEKHQQYEEQFPAQEEKAEQGRQERDLAALQKVFKGIGASNNDNDAEKALAEFRNYLKPKGVIKTGKHFNTQLLLKAFELYAQHYKAFGDDCDSRKNKTAWRKVVGYVQRYLPACYAQALCQGLHAIVENGEKLRRSLEFCENKGVHFYPLDSDSSRRLGFYFVVLGTRQWVGVSVDEDLCAWVAYLENYVKQKQGHWARLVARSSGLASSPEEKPARLSSSALTQPKREEKPESSARQPTIDEKKKAAVLKLLAHVLRGEEAEAKAIIEKDPTLSSEDYLANTLDMLSQATGYREEKHELSAWQPTANEKKKAAVVKLLTHVVRGEEAEAKAMIEEDRTLLLESNQVVDYSGRTIEGTAFRLALGAEDVEMAEMIVHYLDDDKKHQQYEAQFPLGEETAESGRQQRDEAALQEVFQAIGESKDDQGCEPALKKFRDHLKPREIIKTGKHFNAQLLMKAFECYGENYEAFGGRPDSRKNKLAWCQVIGYIQRYLPACYAQAYCQGLLMIVGNGEKLQRSLEFRYDKGVHFYPLDLESTSGLGFDFVAGTSGGRWWMCVRLGLSVPGFSGDVFYKNYVKQKQGWRVELRNSLAGRSPISASRLEEKYTGLPSSALTQAKGYREEKRESSARQPRFFPAVDEKKKAAVLKLLTHVVRGEEQKAHAIIKKDPTLLLERGQVRDYSGRRIEGTAFQLALGAEDVEMAEMIAHYLGDDDKRQQYEAQFPAGKEEAEQERQRGDEAALQEVFRGIGASNNDQDCETALKKFRDHLKPRGVINTGKHFNAQLLMKAFERYEENYEALGRKNKRAWCQVIGYIQRYLPACYAQAFCQGIDCIVEGVEKLHRSLEFREDIGVHFYPLDSDSRSRLGFDFAVACVWAGGWLMWAVDGRRGATAAAFGKLCQAKTAEMQRIMQQQSTGKCCCVS